jgi:glutathione S-transferase
MAGGAVKVYGSTVSPFVATVLVCLEEVGAAYEFVPLDMAAREQKAPHHLARNVRALSLRFAPAPWNSNSSSL